MNIALLGFDLEGRASYDYFASCGDTITICDQNPDVELPAGVASQLGENYLDDLDRFDLLVRTPGLHPAKILAKNPGLSAKITSGTNEFLKSVQTNNIIGVTGTKGKGTTSTLIAKMLEAAGRKVFLGGNIGVPALSFVQQAGPDDWVVLELSSFQLQDIQYSPHLAVCLMIVPEHLNWHADMNEYLHAKANLFAHQTADDVAIYFAGDDDSCEIANTSPGEKLPFFTPPGAAVEKGVISISGQEVIQTSELKLLGEHNWQNVCAAITAAWQAGVKDVRVMHRVLASFSGLPHRLELVRELGGVNYYDDSFGTTPETAIVAMQAFAEPKVLILGGSDKGAEYTDLAEAVKASNVRQVLLIGDQADRIKQALDAAGYSSYQAGGTTMAEIITTARQLAKPGDVVLLSTGCASFGMFHDYKDRGDQFKQVVQALA